MKFTGDSTNLNQVLDQASRNIGIKIPPKTSTAMQGDPSGLQSAVKRSRIELINWVLENMKDPNIQICDLVESKMNEIILTINQTYSIFEADKLHSELRFIFTTLSSSFDSIAQIGDATSLGIPLVGSLSAGFTIGLIKG